MEIDPDKWLIWTLSKLRRVRTDAASGRKIRSAQREKLGSESLVAGRNETALT